MKQIKGGKSMNPADAHRKEIRKKELKRNKIERQKGKEIEILRKDPEKIKEEIYKLERLKADGPLEIQRKHKLRQKKDELELVLKKRKECKEETPEKPKIPVIFKNWVLPRREISATLPLPPPPPPLAESSYVNDIAVISSLPVPPPPPLPPKPANIMSPTFKLPLPPTPPPGTSDRQKKVGSMVLLPPPPIPAKPANILSPNFKLPPPPPPPPPPGTCDSQKNVASMILPPPPPPPLLPPKLANILSSTFKPPLPPTPPPGTSDSEKKIVSMLPPPPPPPLPTHARAMTMPCLLPNVWVPGVSFGPPPPPPRPPTMTRPPSTPKTSHIRSAAPTAVKRPLAQNNPELTSMIPASVRVKRETIPQKPRPKPPLSTLTRTSDPFGLKRTVTSASAPKSCSIDESYTVFLEDMKALGAL